jgi:hypothetical protein
MRPLAASLLLLLLPGLLLPAGAVLRVCLCAWHGVPAGAGCRAAQDGPKVAPDAARQAGCAKCRAHARMDAATPTAQPIEHTSCHCVIVDGPDEPMQGTSPPAGPPLRAPSAAVMPALVLPAPYADGADGARTWPPAHDRPPPPHRQRNLPLRL